MWQFCPSPQQLQKFFFFFFLVGHFVYETGTILNITYFKEEVQKAIWGKGEEYVIA